MLTVARKPILVYSVGHLTDVTYSSVFNPCTVEPGFCVSGLRPVKADINRDDKYLSSYITDMPEPTHQLTALTKPWQ
jgi:hypothetical protein